LVFLLNILNNKILTFANFIVNNLIPVTIGNIIGGALVGLAYWQIYLRLNEEEN